MIVKHLFQRTMSKNGKTFKAWYFWYKTPEGKIIRKSCGQNGKPCLLKRDAMAYLESLKDEDLVPSVKKSFVLKDFATGMYDENSVWVIKQANRGIKYKNKTLKDKRTYLKKVLEKWGDVDPTLIDENDVENWLMEYARSGGWKNHITRVFEDIYEELYAYKIINRIPRFKKMLSPRFSNKDIITNQEINLLFPMDFNAMADIWGVQGEDRISSFSTGVLLYTILTLGLRNSEGRVLSYEQVLDNNMVLIDRMENCDGFIEKQLKKGTDENPKWRLVILPEKTKQLLIQLTELRSNSSGLFFDYPLIHIISKDALELRFKRTLRRMGFDTINRHLTVHSLRFTYNSMLRNRIPDQMLRQMVGHTSQIMTDYYDKSDIDMKSRLLLPEKTIVDSVF